MLTAYDFIGIFLVFIIALFSMIFILFRFLPGIIYNIGRHLIDENVKTILGDELLPLIPKTGKQSPAAQEQRINASQKAKEKRAEVKKVAAAQSTEVEQAKAIIKGIEPGLEEFLDYDFPMKDMIISYIISDPAGSASFIKSYLGGGGGGGGQAPAPGGMVYR